MLLSLATFAQKNKDNVILKIDKKPVYESEFLRLFGKNKNLKINGETPSVDDDIQLFIDYKLKLIEAKELQMDTVPSYVEEVSKYRGQLVLPYLNDNSLIDSIVREAYQRSLKEIKARHILIKVTAGSKDTIAAYEKISKIRNQILAGESFTELAKINSEDPSAKKNGGDLGFFSVFKMVYAFENAAYTTPVGDVSEVFRSQFGYHILQVDAIRDYMGEIEVAHIMIRDTTKTGASTIDKVYREIVGGGDFEVLAKKYSDDKRSATKGGKLSKFTIGAVPVPFGEISFSLNEVKEYSTPFRTDYGWHIVRYIKHYPVGSFEDTEKQLMEKTKRDVRSKTLSNPVVLRLKKEYTIEINEASKKDFESLNFKMVDSLDIWLVKIENDTLTQKDFSAFISQTKDKKSLEIFDTFLDEEILSYYKEHLEETDEDFKNLFKEYKNGLLLFDLMKLKIWDAAQNDSIGIQNFYATHKDRYIKPETFKTVVVSTKDKEEAASLYEYIKESASIDSIQDKLASKEHVLVKSGNFEKDNSIFPKEVRLEINTTNTYEEEGYFITVKILTNEAAVLQEFEDVKGKVISDFQNEIQDNWMEELRAKHTIKIYKRRVKKVASKMGIYSE
jgi:peptidyl-prolyl cis-trans isomerase SurA